MNTVFNKPGTHNGVSFMVLFLICISGLFLCSCDNMPGSASASPSPAQVYEYGGYEEYEKALSEGEYMLILFANQDSEPCQQMEKVVYNLMQKWGGRAVFIYADIGQDQQFIELSRSKYDIQALPTIVFIDNNGEMKKKSVGVVDENIVDMNIDSLIKN